MSFFLERKKKKKKELKVEGGGGAGARRRWVLEILKSCLVEIKFFEKPPRGL